ncbi:MAG: hypothetical protein IJ105_04975 [Bacilli bacterium]|nr:hypothetical protein [Bacilli bacterium]
MSLKHFNKTQVLSSYNKERIIFLIGVVSIFFSSIISVFAANYLYSSSEVSFDNSSSGISSDNVQGAIDELYQNASDYSSLDSRIGALEGHFTANGDRSVVGTNSSTADRGYYVKDHSGVSRAAFLYNDSAENVSLVSYNSTGTWNNFGPLALYGSTIDLRGNPVKVNGTSLSNLLVTKTISAQIVRTPGKYADITAPTVSGYTFSHWNGSCSTIGWIGSVYVENATYITSRAWLVAVHGSTASTTNTINCTAVYYKTF